MEHTCIIHDRQYVSWEFCPPLPISPIDHHLFHEDRCIYNPETNEITVRSAVRETPYIAGVLVLENGKTYGRTPNKKRLYYSCVPHNKKLPVFLIPYNLDLGFSKSIPNKYVIFTFDSWNGKHPIGQLKETIGDVTDLPSYYEYQIYCKYLHISIVNATKIVNAKRKEDLTSIILTNQLEIQDRREIDRHIISIDPAGCIDRDDAFSIQFDGTQYKVSVYIANVWVWLETFKLWNVIGERKSTIYLPDRNRPMLPPALIDFCSLDARKPRFAFVLDFIIKDDIIDISSLSQVCIKVSKNFDYESTALLKNERYQMLLDVTQRMEKHKLDSHSVVSFWMTKMNSFLANRMREKGTGIFRVVEGKCDNPTFIQIWENQIAGNYVKYGNTDLHHSIMNGPYIHFTSPIRRMCDLLNQMLWVRDVVKHLSPEFIGFLEKQMNEIDSLNKQMKDIRKIQTDSNMLHQCFENPDLMKQTFEGIILNKSENKYTIYIETHKWILSAKSETSYEKYQCVSCKLFMFTKEDQLKRKIRLQII
jgi:exoribonuclease R